MTNSLIARTWVLPRLQMLVMKGSNALCTAFLKAELSHNIQALCYQGHVQAAIPLSKGSSDIASIMTLQKRMQQHTCREEVLYCIWAASPGRSRRQD